MHDYAMYSILWECTHVIEQDGIYFRLGQLMAMALIHGGAAVRILSPSVFDFLRGMKPGDIIVGIDEVADADIKRIVKKVFTHAISAISSL